METETITSTRSSWQHWAEFLRQRRLESLAASALEAIGPMAVVGAQLLHAGSPFLRPVFSTSQVSFLASLLENPTEMHDFAAYLREEQPL